MGNYLIDIGSLNPLIYLTAGEVMQELRGNKNRNSTLGFIGYNLNVIEYILWWLFWEQVKLSERFTLAGESLGLTIDNVQFIFLNSIILNWIRNSNEDWV